MSVDYKNKTLAFLSGLAEPWRAPKTPDFSKVSTAELRLELQSLHELWRDALPFLTMLALAGRRAQELQKEILRRRIAETPVERVGKKSKGQKSKNPLAELEKLYPGVDFRTFLQEMGVEGVESE